MTIIASFFCWLRKRKIKMMVDAEYQRLVNVYRYERPPACEERISQTQDGKIEIRIHYNKYNPIITGPLSDDIKNQLKREAESNILNSAILERSAGKGKKTVI